MKGCVIAGVVLALVLLAVVGNAMFVRGAVAKMTDMLKALPIEPDPLTTPAEVASLREVLEDKEAILGLSVSFATVDRAVEALRTLEAAAKAGDIHQYRETLATVEDLMEDIGRLEKLSVKNLL